MSAMQRHLQARTTNQAEIIGTVANESALAVISRASGEQGKFAIFHHISTESHASKGGAVSVPTVFSCHGLYEAKVAVWTHQSRWEVLSKSTLPAEIPTLPTILAREGSSEAEEKEGPLERVPSAAFIVVNGRALEELEKHIDSSYDSLLKALVDLASRDLIADFEESNPGETPPSIPELARIKIKNREEVPFGQQIMVVYSWIAAPEKHKPAPIQTSPRTSDATHASSGSSFSTLALPTHRCDARAAMMDKTNA